MPYVYEMSSVLDSAAKRQAVIYTGYPEDRILLNEHGLRIVAIQSGSLGAFDVGVLLTVITSSLTLLAVANTVVDSLAIYVLPEKNFYRVFKYPKTPHVTDLVEAKEKRASLTIVGTAVPFGCVVLFDFGGCH